VTFGSSLEALGTWRDTRLPFPRYLPFAALLVWAAKLGNAASMTQVAADFLLALALVAQFRLWDDLVDRGRDREQQPDRILVRALNCAPFVAAIWLLGLGNALAFVGMHGMHASLGFALLNVVAACWYRWHRQRALVHALVLHLKYPAFVVLIAAPVTRYDLLSLAAGIVYTAVLAFELLDAPGMRAGTGRWILTLCLCVLAAAPLAWGSGRAELAAACVLGALLLAAWWPPGHSHSHPARRYLPFVAAAISFAFAPIGGIS